ncbi:glycosyltransferase [Mycolicibacterium sediminis]|uniref:Glycosyl transferase family 28 C-terminal domain-containing protein n=1 Tax=Mycolicibacterium sediminis TaxID=1286180 RepID=A0A7I7R076_9MYCO|nr:glycosyltransferase [Mycolicibacterium sediminis]BBY31470.1 hypothetical protein MSEDJ_55660 [Mycolicibacterium sediminis]
MICYYVHHHGRGHLNRALAITRHLDEQVTFLSSSPRPAGLRAGDRWVDLPMDVPPPGGEADDVTANGRLHWVPRHVDGLARRAAVIADVLAVTSPRRIVVDVSVEVTLLARLCGIPVTVMGMPGLRDDAAHRLAYDVADQIIAPWSVEAYRPDWLSRYGPRVHAVGSISRFDGVPRPAMPDDGVTRGLLLAGAGGSTVPACALEDLRAAAPGLEWIAAGGGSAWVDDPWPLISTADLVVSHAGQNAVADVALAGASAVVIPEERPFAEQFATAEALAASDVCVVVESWPTRAQWPALIDRALRSDRGRWSALRPEGSAARAAAVLAS